MVTHSPSGADVVIVGAARTPHGRLLGQLASYSAPALGAVAIAGALGSIPAAKIEAVFMGQVLQAGAGQNPAKQAALAAGISPSAHTSTVNKVCLSGLAAIIDAARLIRSGEASVVVAGGMESMTQAPHLLRNVRTQHKYGDITAIDHMAFDGLTAADLGISMGELSEKYADVYPVTREEQDAYAAESHRRAAAAWDSGIMAREVVPVGECTSDQGVRPDTTAETLAKLRPAFVPTGTITAGNSSPMTDGAAAVVLTTRDVAKREGWDVLATLCAVGQTAGPDSSLQQQPADALRVALERQGWAPSDLDIVEINEAFAAVVVHSANVLGIDPAVINANGGAISLGHPIGASGARLVVHAAHQLAAGAGERAGVALCGGGGQGEALLLAKG